MLSMTGYGKAEYNKDGLSFTVEVRSVNNRNLDLSVKLPRVLVSLEDAIRQAVCSKIQRGKVDVFVNFTDLRDKEKVLDVNYALADTYVKTANDLSRRFKLKNDYTVSDLLKNSDIVKEINSDDDYSAFNDVLSDLVLKALDEFNVMRKREGDKLYQDMTARVKTIKGIVDNISIRAPLVVSEYKEKLRSRIEEALKDVKIDEARLLNEVAFFTDKANIDEELTRLNSHIVQFGEIVKTEPCGKKLDFLIQEFNREANTICSKANDIQVTNYGLSLKNEIEKIREQVQNVE